MQQIPRHVSQGLRRKSRHWSSRFNSHAEELGRENDETLGGTPTFKVADKEPAQAWGEDVEGKRAQLL